MSESRPAPPRRDAESLGPTFAQRVRIPWVVLVASLVITAVGTWGVYDRVRAHDADRMSNGVEATHSRIEARLNQYIALLHGAAGLVSALGGEVSLDEFQTFASGLQIKERYPGIQGIGFSQRVQPGEEAAVVEVLRRQGMTDAAVWPETAPEDRHAIVYLEPLDVRNRAALGYNMFSEPTRRDAMARARDSGDAALSGRVTLKQEIALDSVQAGFLIYMPVYRGGETPLTTEARREALQGFVYAPFRANDLFNGVFRVGERPRVAFRIYDGRVRADSTLLHDSRTANIDPLPGAAYTEDRALILGGHQWTIALAPSNNFGDASRRWLAPIVAVIGGLLSVLLFGLSRAQVRAEAAARERERDFRTTLESLPAGVFVAEDDGHITFSNTAVQRIFMGDAPVAEAERADFDRWWTGVVRDFADRHAVVGQALEGEEDVSETAEVTAYDGTARTLLVAAFPLHNRGGRAERAVAAIVDLTEQRRAREAEALAIREQVAREAAEAREAQLRRHATELERSNRELQDFAYVASHDLQEPLRKISAFSDLLRAEYAETLDGPATDYLDRMQHAALRMSRLIKDLLAFSRVTTRAQPFGPVDLDTILEEVLGDVALRLEETGGHVETEPLPTVEADPTQLRQLLLNLVGNALKFHRPDVPPVVRIRGGLQPAAEVAAAGFAAVPDDGPWCRIEVEDNGIGFEEKYLDRIFTPFQRLHGHEAYEGTGMGLAICRRIVERHEGFLEARSTLGEGSTFVVWLPKHRPAAAAAAVGMEEERG